METVAAVPPASDIAYHQTASVISHLPLLRTNRRPSLESCDQTTRPGQAGLLHFQQPASESFYSPNSAVPSANGLPLDSLCRTTTGSRPTLPAKASTCVTLFAVLSRFAC
ncbi:hypothetical protein NW759_014926 [Fusarium solani]|nr:hypothetical protein NW759_014926 [Fusarium solani]